MELIFEDTPKPGTDEMVTLVHAVLCGALREVPTTMSSGDVMSACMFLLIETALPSNPPLHQLRADVMKSFDLSLSFLLGQNGELN